jgi:serine/threonine protein kinase
MGRSEDERPAERAPESGKAEPARGQFAMPPPRAQSQPAQQALRPAARAPMPMPPPRAPTAPAMDAKPPAAEPVPPPPGATRRAGRPAASPPPPVPPAPAPSPFASASGPKLAGSRDKVAGDVIAGRYRVTRPLGRGGMGAVYLCEQLNLGRSVAVKILSGTADPTMAARFQREARLIAQFHHPHVVGLIDFGDDDGALFLVMEYIDGETLTALLAREGALPEVRVVELATQIVEALAVAHGMGIIHRDVKPDNIMVTRSSTGREFVKVLDFGVAKMNRDEGHSGATVNTMAGLIVGSLRFISPEQVESRPVTAQTDLYGFGCVLYQMLTGRQVFTYESSADCALAHLSERPARPTLHGLPLAGPMVELTMQCLEKNPAARPSDARTVLDALLDLRVTLEAATPPRSTGALRPLRIASVPAMPPTAAVTPSDPQTAATARTPDVHSARTEAELRGALPTERPRQPDARTGTGSRVMHDIDAVPLLRAIPEIARPAPTAEHLAPAASGARRGVPLWVWILVAAASGGALALLALP